MSARMKTSVLALGLGVGLGGITDTKKLAGDPFLGDWAAVFLDAPARGPVVRCP